MVHLRPSPAGTRAGASQCSDPVKARQASMHRKTYIDRKPDIPDLHFNIEVV
jgi:hypothetical protein